MIQISDADTMYVIKWLTDYADYIYNTPDLRHSLRKNNSARMARILAGKLKKKLNAIKKPIIPKT